MSRIKSPMMGVRPDKNRPPRRAEVSRKTLETEISGSLILDGRGRGEIETPVGFFSHMLETFARHGRMDLVFRARGDLEVDQHHLLEDSGLVLGKLFDKALGERKGIQRAGFFVHPMDEALAVASVDIGGRPHLQFQARFQRRFCGDLDLDVLPDFFQGMSLNLRANLSLWSVCGRSDHHRVEALFKALGRAVRDACRIDPGGSGEVLSGKGVIDDDRNY